MYSGLGNSLLIACLLKFPVMIPVIALSGGIFYSAVCDAPDAGPIMPTPVVQVADPVPAPVVVVKELPLAPVVVPTPTPAPVVEVPKPELKPLPKKKIPG